MAAIRLQAHDQNENIVSYYQEPVRIVTEGPIELIGPDIIALRGGMGGTYVKTVGKDCTIEVEPEGLGILHIRAK